MAKKRYKSSTISNMGKIGVGLAAASLAIPVAAKAAEAAPAGTPNLMGGFSAMGSMAGTAVTVGMGAGILGDLKALNKKNKRRGY